VSVPGSAFDGRPVPPEDPAVAPDGPAVPAEIREAMGADPTTEQWQAISMPLEPYVIVAGAGSGKTSVMAARVVYLALVAAGRLAASHSGLLPGNVLCLTFTVKATENLTLRVRRALSSIDLPEGEEPTVLNYHQFAAEILERHGLLGGIEPGQRVLSAAQRTELCARVLDEQTFTHVKAEWQPTLIENILTLADQMANHRLRPKDVVDFNRQRLDDLQEYRTEHAYRAALQRIELAEAVERFQRLKEELGVIDFGDQITKALEIVERFPDVAHQYRARYQTVLLDEYQDTNVAQAELISGVFGEGFPVTAVGDPDQNIYAWRGASLYNLMQFEERFRKGDGSSPRKLPLYTNFRSGSRILEAADAIIAPLPSDQRPDPDKKLVAFPPNGMGHVELVKLTDEWSEAAWIADRIVALHDEDPGANSWSTFAVLCRKSRLFGPLQDAFAERSVPTEFVGLAGLLSLPEVVEVLAYARAVANPMANVSLARILMGPRYRVGFKDLARVGAWAKDRNYGLRDEDADEDTPSFVFSEAVEHLDEVMYLSDDGRARLEEFRNELAELRVQARKPVGEFLAEVIRRTGMLAELEASGDLETATAKKRNLAAFLDQVNAFSPLEGELTLQSFLDFVDTVEGADRQEWAPVQPSGENSVKVMTIHQAKGLEFDTVFVPGLAEGILPDLQIQHNPVERGKSLDFELRGDRDILPSFQGLGKVLSAFKAALKAQEAIEERRTFYVALTRARKRLYVTGAHWYGEDVQSPKKPSQFFEELATWGDGVAGVVVDRGPEASPDNPLSGLRERFVSDWPGPALRVDADRLFPEGWRQAALHASASPSGAGEGPPVHPAVASLRPDEGEQYREASASLRLLATHLVEREHEPAGLPPPPKTVAVGNIVEYERCPKRFYWTAIRPLPRFSGPAARVGTQIHSWIERRSSGQASLIELDEQPDLTAEELTGEPGKIDRLQKAFAESRFARAVPLFAERPFLLYIDGFVVGGRIDAIFGVQDGPWEVVDYKTGRRPPQDDPQAGLQLDLYALACVDVWAKAARDITLTYFYLASGEEVTRPAGDVEATRGRVGRALAGIAETRFDPTPGSQCRWCDFLSFCDAGRAYVAGRSGRGGMG
jgi:DNA helicase-2/ATP-dependent DNA helicase PcrA